MQQLQQPPGNQFPGSYIKSMFDGLRYLSSRSSDDFVYEAAI
jgi:hypothetical protein